MKKTEILDELAGSREEFIAALDDLSDEQLLEPGVNGDWSIKDILYHLTTWEAETVKLLWQVSQAETPTTLHFSGRSVDEINAEWMEAAPQRSLEQVWEDLEAVRKQTIRRVSAMKDQDFENPARFTWLKGIPLWKWIAEDTFIHEDEHLEQILAWRENKGIANE